MHQIGLNDQEQSDFAQEENLSAKEAQIIVYKNLDLVGQYYFSNTKITIGKSKNADVTLADPRLAEIQAIVHIQNDNIIISDQSERAAIHLNGKPVKAAVLEPFDLVELSDFGLKIETITSTDKKKRKNNSATVPRLSKPQKAINPKKRKRKQGLDFSDDFFTLPPYRKTEKQKGNGNGKKVGTLNRSSMQVDDSNREEVFTLPIDRKRKQRSDRHNGSSGSKTALKSKKTEYSEDFFDLPPYQVSKKKTSPEADSPLRPVTSASVPSLYNIVFTGKLKPERTLLQVKADLNRRYGIDYRQLTRLVKGRPVILKRNLTRKNALKWHKAFESSGAICSIASKEAAAENPNRRNKNARGLEREQLRKNIFQRPNKKREKQGNVEKKNTFSESSFRSFSELNNNLDNSFNRLKKTTPPPVIRKTTSSASKKKEKNLKRHSSGRNKKTSSETAEKKSADPNDFNFSTDSFTDTETLASIIRDEDQPFREAEDISSDNFAESALEKFQTSTEPIPDHSAASDDQHAEDEASAKQTFTMTKQLNRHTNADYWDDDEDDEDFPADFRLKEKIINAAAIAASNQTDYGCIEVVKTLNHAVVDVVFINKGQKYFIHNEGGRKFKLAENKGKARCFYYLNNSMDAEVKSPGGDFQTDVAPSSSMGGFGFKSRKNRHAIEDQSLVKISDDRYDFQLRHILPTESPKVQVTAAEKPRTLRHILHSAVFHMVLLLFMGLIPWTMTPEAPEEPESQFAKIDPDLLANLEKAKAPPKKIELKPKKIEPLKPIEPPPPVKKPKPEKPVKTIAKKKPVAKPTRTAKTSKRAKKATVAAADRHPNAGGGAGKGNVVNRDVKQVGLLSMIGDSVGIQPQEATAAVTNLDAVASRGAKESNFKVGGIAGKLGKGKIAVPSGGYVATKGSTQVLRSKGASGTGRVAALERGDTGEKQVKGMVSAKMTRKVDIRGGMSRDAVKRVIDQHLDEISYCYETALINNPSIMGRMTYEWKIKANGTVGEVNIKSATVNSRDIHACIKAAIKSWKFPQPQGAEVLVSYPFIFDIVGF